MSWEEKMAIFKEICRKRNYALWKDRITLIRADCFTAGFTLAEYIAAFEDPDADFNAEKFVLRELLLTL